MSGPIVRKYGFPNFEKIFGERELKHGVEGEPTTPPASPSPAEPTKPDQAAEPTKPDADRPKP
jgi:hypothetical protein